MKQNVYDDPVFFAGYNVLRERKAGLNEVLEQPAMQSLLPDVLYILPNMTRNGRPAAILENIVVDEAQRGQGIGRAMLEYARERALEHGCYKLSLTSNARRADAHEFYRCCGMVQHGVSFRYQW